MIVALREKHRIPPYLDLPALLELLSAALTLFALRAAHAPGAGRAGSRAAPSPAFDPATPEGVAAGREDVGGGDAGVAGRQRALVTDW